MRKEKLVLQIHDRITLPRHFEVVELKGPGHPDTIASRIAETLAAAPPFSCEGHAPYYYLDKVYLLPGRTVVDFGSGRMTIPARICSVVVASKPPNRELIDAKIGSLMTELAPELKYELVIDTVSASDHSTRTFDLEPNDVAEDSTVAIAYYPPSSVESLCSRLDGLLERMRSRCPAIGSDRKVMLTKVFDKLTVTTAIAFRSPYLSSLQAYLETKEAVRSELESFLKQNGFPGSEIYINPDDRPELKSVYLTFTGLSVESTDCGFVGRGNRLYDVLAPLRPSSCDALAGKSWVNHPARLYHVASMASSQRICRQFGADEVTVVLVAQIGHSMRDPIAAFVEIFGLRQRSEQEVQGPIAVIISEEIENALETSSKQS